MNLFRQKLSDERGETLPGVIATAIVSAIVILGVAGVMAVTMNIQASSEGNMTVANAANTVESVLKEDVSQSTVIVPSEDHKTVAIHLADQTLATDCRVALWQIHGDSVTRSLFVYSGVEGGFCDTDTEITGSSRTLVNSGFDAPNGFQFYNTLNREVELNADGDLNFVTAEICPLDEGTYPDGCAITEGKVSDEWNSPQVANLSLGYSIQQGSHKAERQVNSVSANFFYQGSTSNGSATPPIPELTSWPGKPQITLPNPAPFMNQDTLITWVDDPTDVVPEGYSIGYVIRVADQIVSTQAGNTYTLDVGLDPVTMTVQKTYTRASITLYGDESDVATITPRAPLPLATPVLTLPATNVYGNSVTASWTAVECTVGSGATSRYTLFDRNNAVVYSGPDLTAAFVPEQVVSVTYTVRIDCMMGADAVSGVTSDPREILQLLPNPGSPTLNAINSVTFALTPIVNLSWTAPDVTCTPGSTMGYEVVREGEVLTKLAPTARNYVDRSPLKDRISSNYMVRATCAMGTLTSSADSNTEAMTYTVPTPTAVRSLAAPAVTELGAQVNVTWAQPAAFCNTGMVREYEVFRNGVLASVQPTVNYLDTTPGTGFTTDYSVRVLCSAPSLGVTNTSDAVNDVVEHRITPVAPEFNVASSMFKGNVNMTFTHHVDACAPGTLSTSVYRGGSILAANLIVTSPVANLSTVDTAPNTSLTESRYTVRSSCTYGNQVTSSGLVTDTAPVVMPEAQFTYDTTLCATAPVLSIQRTNLTLNRPPIQIISPSGQLNNMIPTVASRNVTINEPGVWRVVGPTNSITPSAGGMDCLTEVPRWDSNSEVTVANNMFRNATNLTNVGGFPSTITTAINMFENASKFNAVGATNWNTSNVTNMQGMFKGASSFSRTLLNWDTSKVTTMAQMFEDAAVFNGPLTNWDTSNVTAMWSMFKGASAFNRPVNQFDMSNVTNINSMFYDAKAFNQPVNTWDTSKVTSMALTFSGASAFNRPVTTFDTSLVTTMYGLFSATNAFNQPLTGWDTSKVTDMSFMFQNARAFNQPVNALNTSNVTNLSSMFLNANVFNSSVANLNVAKVTNMSNMFAGAKAFNQPLTGWVTTALTNISNMFSYADTFNQPVNHLNVSKVTQLDTVFRAALDFNQPLDNWNTGAVTSLQGTFAYAMSFNQNLNSWNTNRVTNMVATFRGATVFNNGDVALAATTPLTWNTANVRNMNSMFNGSYNAADGIVRPTGLEYAFRQPLTGFNTGRVTDMGYVFYKSGYTGDLSSWNTANVTTLQEAFHGGDTPAGITGVPAGIGSWNVGKVTNFSHTFDNTRVTQSLANWNTAAATNMSGMFFNSNTNQDLSAWNVTNVTNWEDFKAGPFATLTDTQIPQKFR